MFYNFSARNLAFLQAIASVMVLASAPCYAADNPYRQAAQIAATHCKLWQRQLQHQPPAILWEDYHHLLGRSLAEKDAEALYASTQGIAYFDFLLGDWAEVATRVQHHDFNEGMFHLLQPYWAKTAPQKDDSCQIDITLTERENQPKPPALRYFHAKAHTLLEGLSVTYTLTQDDFGWQLTNISLGETSLAKKYTPMIAKKLRHGGFEELLAGMQPPTNPTK